MSKDKIVDFNQAEKNARLRDLENSKILTEDDMKVADELQAKANARGMKLVPERRIKNRAKFAQLIQDNIDYLEEINYFDNKEIVFLWKISRKVGFLSNCIVDDIHKKSPVPLTQTEIAAVVKRTKNNINPIINSLVDKGILAVSETGLLENNARANAYFMNPNIIFAGNKDDVNLTLRAMFSKIPKELKKLPVKLF
ncbi:MarR family transcriptional regulator [Bacillus pacificus]|uniref:MarR family transcriptional regulator n=1 Tax=Bacillus TaxID=1386 RepID=UPI001261A7CB|nr:MULTISPECIES: MarR family transcriptional regulator [Bacillus]KAB7629981.1 MarR family transcriptional regulator [Bacillus sp. B4-WWTP-NA-D-NA-NA]MCC2414370.1 MarR family transcriptional regulator [Bacillus paranthracis]MCU5259652.1 MarR family transcriptional regulator [Bacillus pacificus]